ncbi:hypothetical protein [Actinomadura harenae]|uniref:Uncharacterized protein n=1 Tax=Actinomadura harenae TaxID=2483351 RepID=A0A3M2M8I0_9ACTN|nr:hypothetical protein [Actinomadura harenae]RMI46124.1 hypothetical protein EBO15_07840 [Actinomadura harenae]
MLNARLLDLDVLDVEGAVAMLEETLRIADPDDTRIPADPVGAAELARVCGYLPLALQIAAALLAEDPDHTPAVRSALKDLARAHLIERGTTPDLGERDKAAFV